MSTIQINKLCIYCRITKPIVDFNKRKNSRDGYRNNCKQCRKPEEPAKARKRSREHYHKNREKQLSNSKLWAKNNREKVLAYKRKYNAKNKDKINRKASQYRHKNKARINQLWNQYYCNNKQKVFAYLRNYRSCQKELGGDIYAKAVLRARFGIKNNEITSEMLRLQKKIISIRKYFKI